MARITGIGGIFMRVENPAEAGAWYRRVLGIDINAAWNGAKFTPGDMAAQEKASQVFALFSADSTYFQPSPHPFMINLCVDDLDGVLAKCAAEGVEPIWREDSDGMGRFAHIIGPGDVKIELWQPA